MTKTLSDALNKAMTGTEKANDSEMTAILDDLTRYQDRRQSELEDALRQAQQNGTNLRSVEQDLKRAQQAITDLEVLKRAEVIIANRRYEIRQQAIRRPHDELMKLIGE